MQQEQVIAFIQLTRTPDINSAELKLTGILINSNQNLAYIIWIDSNGLKSWGWPRVFSSFLTSPNLIYSNCAMSRFCTEIIQKLQIWENLCLFRRKKKVDEHTCSGNAEFPGKACSPRQLALLRSPCELPDMWQSLHHSLPKTASPTHFQVKGPFINTALAHQVNQ